MSWVDTAKGLGIILVVIGHVLRGVVSSNIMTWTPAVRYADTWIYAFHMPLFFFISGLFLSHSTTRTMSEFGWQKVRTIAYPYFLWSFITLLIKGSLGQSVNHPRSLSQFPAIFYQPIEQFWFLYVLFFISVTFGFLLQAGARNWTVLLLAALIYPGILSFASGWEPLEDARYYAIYLALGILFGSDKLFPLFSATGIRVLAAILATGLFVVSSLAVFLETPHNRGLDLFLAVAGIAGVIACALLLNRARIDSAIRFLGRYSLEIYVVHTIASASIRIAFQKLLHITEPAPHLLFGTIFGLYVPALLAISLKRIDFQWAFILPKRGTASHPSKV